MIDETDKNKKPRKNDEIAKQNNQLIEKTKESFFALKRNLQELKQRFNSDKNIHQEIRVAWELIKDFEELNGKK